MSDKTRQNSSGILTDEHGLSCRFKRTGTGFILPDGMPEGVSYDRVFKAANAAGIRVAWASGGEFTSGMQVTHLETLR